MIALKDTFKIRLCKGCGPMTSCKREMLCNLIFLERVNALKKQGDKQFKDVTLNYKQTKADILECINKEGK